LKTTIEQFIAYFTATMAKPFRWKTSRRAQDPKYESLNSARIY
jgi:hypothetical protein